jgi:formylglycine-generating enzyme required for sulfatase activity
MTGFKDGSGTAVRDLEITPDNHLILMASDRLEKARELEILGGSFLTANVCTALSTKLEEADKDGDSRLSVQELKLWLDECAKEHNKKYPALSVPYPYLFGQQKGGFFLTLGNSPWEPYEIPFPDGSTMVVLPSKDEYGRALLVSKYPVTNKQYRDFVNEARGKVSEPVGEHFIDGRWQGSFYPWRHPEFEDPEKPVVCVNAEEASWYCFWLDESNIDGCYVSLPHVYEWDFAAFGTFYPNSDPQTWLSTGQIIHHKAQYPAIIDKSGGRTNIRGISDLIGNVWEWCGGTNDSFYEPVIINRPRETRRTEVRGGSYLDDLERTRPFVEAHLLEKGTRTSHSDLGFRISARMAVSHLPSEVQKALIGRERVSLSRLINARLMRNSSMRKRATWSEGKEAGKDDKVSM